jgi:hypothetical protein
MLRTPYNTSQSYKTQVLIADNLTDMYAQQELIAKERWQLAGILGVTEVLKEKAQNSRTSLKDTLC